MTSIIYNLIGNSSIICCLPRDLANTLLRDAMTTDVKSFAREYSECGGLHVGFRAGESLKIAPDLRSYLHEHLVARRQLRELMLPYGVSGERV